MNIQIELTNRCPFECDYCVRKIWSAKPCDISLERVKDLIETFDPERIALYGYGDPTIHKNVRDIVRIAKKRAEVVMVTRNYNFRENIDLLVYSIDTLSEFKKVEGYPVSIIITKDNADLIRKVTGKAKEVYLTNLIPYNREMYEKTAFAEISKKMLDVCIDIIGDENFLRNLVKMDKNAVERYRKMLEVVENVNVRYLVDKADRILTALKFESLLSELNVNKPNMFAGERKCPYENYVFVRADGKIFPCMELAYEHPLYLGYSTLTVECKSADKSLPYPWCGDCQFLEGCWFVENGFDCYGYECGCSRCLFSVGIARCLI
ncbi:radical SAM/SPASM domain-containing protein [Archaeoglobus profundus]|nr:radical SAM protein [Archaeoglobus profundus]